MKPIVTPEQMAAADRAAIASGVSSMVLMERAGTAVASATTALAGGAYGQRVLVLCGKGNNAGDGLVAARRLASRGAFPVVALLEDPSSFSPDTAENFASLRNIRLVKGMKAVSRELRRADVVIDAVFGTGFRGEVRGETAGLLEEVNASTVPVVSVDIPSGVDGGSGAVKGAAVSADITVTMGAVKTGLLMPPGSELVGQVLVADIGVAQSLIRSDVDLIEETDVGLALVPRSKTGHKKSVGTVLVIAGSVGMSGAAALAARGAYSAGAGLVTIAAPGSVATQLDRAVLEATTLPLPETGSGTIEPGAVGAILEKAESMDVVALGPGLSTHPETVEFVRKLVEALQRPLVLDADGLSSFEGSVDILRARESSTILTPHPGEAARLLSSTTSAVHEDRLGACRTIAERTGAVVILKGYRSIVARPDGHAAVLTKGGPALATGGTGDVLTGVTAALLASGVPAYEAAWSAAWIHGVAGDILEEEIGRVGATAGDLLPVIPRVMRTLMEPV